MISIKGIADDPGKTVHSYADAIRYWYCL